MGGSKFDSISVWIISTALAVGFFGGIYIGLGRLAERPQLDIEPNLDGEASESTELTGKNDDHNAENKVNLGPSNTKWGYQGKLAPEHWGKLHPSFRTCDSGQNQSPINLSKKNIKRKRRVILETHYQDSLVVIKNEENAFRAVYDPGSYVLLNTDRFDLEELIFHIPSEHTVEEIPYHMELQLVHRDSEGNSLMIALFVEEKSSSHPDLEKLWKYIPSDKSQDSSTHLFNPAGLIPQSQAVYSYAGSLTMPPCSEGVRWVVFEQALQISPRHLDHFSKLFKNNGRPTQSLGGRTLYFQSM